MNNLDKLPEPFIGRMVIETIKEDADEYLKEKMGSELNVSSEFLKKLELQTMDVQVDEHGRKTYIPVKKRVPISKGRIVKMAPDCFGECFVNKYGDVGYTPKLGDIVLFIANESYRIDSADQYHLVCDCDIQGFIKAEVAAKKEVLHE